MILQILILFLAGVVHNQELNPTPFIWNPSESGLFRDVTYSVSIWLQDQGRLCSGIVVNPSMILTTASCIENSNQPIVRIGANSIPLGLNDEVIINPGYTSDIVNGVRLYINNLAVISYEEPLDITVPPLALDTINQQAVSGQIYIVGWGRTQQNGPYSPTYRIGKQVILPQNQCVFRNIRIPNTFCTSTIRNQSGLCPGDSGAAVISAATPGATPPIGLSSFSTRPNECGQATALNFHTALANYVTWIQSL